MINLKKIFINFYILALASGKIKNQTDFSFYEKFQKDLTNADAIMKNLQEILPPTSDDSDMLQLYLKMMDASTKLPSGLAYGNLIDLGNFDECYSLEYKGIFGKYCLGTFVPPTGTQKYFDATRLNHSKLHPVLQPVPDIDPDAFSSLNAIHFAICVPHNVTPIQIPGVKYPENFCYSKATQPELSDGAIVMIIVFSIFAIVILISTIYDIILYYTEKKPHHELFIAFSFLTNGRKLISVNNNPDQLLCLNGIKALSMMWVIIGHEYSCISLTPIINVLDVVSWMQEPANMFINGATVSVDTFFVVGGLVTVYTFMKAMDKGVKFNIFVYYLHRYLRLTPVYLMVCLFTMYLIKYVSDGPLWGNIDSIAIDQCFTGWWSSLLYITNYVQMGICIPQTWYLSVDMQLFLLSPIVLLTLKKSEKIGLILLGILSVLGCVVPFIIGYTEDLTTRSLEYSNLYYYQTHARFGPYVIGMAAGYFIYKYKTGKQRIKLKLTTTLIIWLVLLTGIVANVYAGYPLTVSTIDDVWGSSLFLAFNRPTWAICVSGLIILCVSNYGGPINWFLSLDVFQFLTKLSYSMYLTHATVIMLRMISLRTTVKFTNLQFMHTFWGDFMLSLGVSMILSLAFESPIIIIEKYLLSWLHTENKVGQTTRKV